MSLFLISYFSKSNSLHFDSIRKNFQKFSINSKISSSDISPIWFQSILQFVRNDIKISQYWIRNKRKKKKKKNSVVKLSFLKLSSIFHNRVKNLVARKKILITIFLSTANEILLNRLIEKLLLSRFDNC